MSETWTVSSRAIRCRSTPTGSASTLNGYVWAVTQGTEAYRLDPADGSFEVVKGLVGAYTYSDMTGFALSSVHVP